MLILLGLMAVLESVVVFLLPSGIEPLVAIGRAALGLLKSRTGSTLAKAVSAAFVVLFASNISNVFRVEKRIAKMGASQTDQPIIRSQLLKITLIGYCLLLGLMMTSLDSFLKQVDALTWNIDVLKKQAKDVSTRVASCAGDSNPGKVRETGCVSRHSILPLLLQPVKWRMDSLFL
ncbi:hypothetical protein BDL97_03G012600 [Sphagnum fallax]|nr:hypothetical protein BDL97_03G012600 [Sphagnum fallax]